MEMRKVTNLNKVNTYFKDNRTLNDEEKLTSLCLRSSYQTPHMQKHKI